MAFLRSKRLPGLMGLHGGGVVVARKATPDPRAAIRQGFAALVLDTLREVALMALLAVLQDLLGALGPAELPHAVHVALWCHQFHSRLRGGHTISALLVRANQQVVVLKK